MLVIAGGHNVGNNMRKFFFFFLLFILLIEILNIPSIIADTNKSDSFIKKYEIATSNEIIDINEGPQNKIAILTSSNFEIWQIKNNELSKIITKPSGSTYITWSPSGHWLYDGVYIWNTSNWIPIFRIEGIYGSWSPNEQLFLIHDVIHVYLFDTMNWSIIKIWKNWDHIDKITWITNTEFLILQFDYIYKMNIHSNSSLSAISTSPSTASGMHVEFSLNDNMIALVSNDYVGKIFNLTSGKIIYNLFGHGDKITDIEFSPKNESIISCGSDGQIRIWWKPEISENNISKLFFNKPITKCGWFSNGDYLYTAFNDASVKIMKRVQDILIAEAGDDQTVLVGTEFHFDGSNSQGTFSDNDLQWSIFINESFLGNRIGIRVSWAFNDIGRFKVVLNISNSIGTASDELYIDVVQKSEPPTIEIISPKSSDVVSGITKISGISHDDYKVENVFIKIENSAWQKCDGTEQWSFSIDTRLYEKGFYLILVKANDGYQDSDISHIYLTFDNSLTNSLNPSPKVTIIYPTDGNEVKGTIDIFGTASDNTYISKITVILYENEFNAIGLNHWSYSWDTIQFPDGWYSLGIRAYDEFEKTVTIKISVYINNTGYPTDNYPPMIKIKSPINNAIFSNKSLTINGIANDNVNVRLIQISIDNYSWIDAQGYENWTININSKFISKGNHTIYARAYDGKLFGYDAINLTIIRDKGNIQYLNQNEMICSLILILFLLFLFIIIVEKIAQQKLKSYKRYKRRRIKRIYRTLLTIIVCVILLSTITYEYQNKSVYNPSQQNNNNNFFNNSKAPDYTFMAIDGTIISNSNQDGKMVIIHFFVIENNNDNELISDLNSIKEIHEKYNNKPITFISLEILNIFSNKTMIKIFKDANIPWHYNIDYGRRIVTDFNQNRSERIVRSGIIIINQSNEIIYFRTSIVTQEIDQAINSFIKP